MSEAEGEDQNEVHSFCSLRAAARLWNVYQTWSLHYRKMRGEPCPSVFSLLVYALPWRWQPATTISLIARVPTSDQIQGIKGYPLGGSQDTRHKNQGTRPCKTPLQGQWGSRPATRLLSQKDLAAGFFASYCVLEVVAVEELFFNWLLFRGIQEHKPYCDQSQSM